MLRNSFQVAFLSRFQKVFHLCLIATMMAIQGCLQQPTTIQNMKEDIAALGALIKLEPTPKSAKWEHLTINPHFGEQAIVALLHYDEKGRKRMEAQMVPLDYELSNVPDSVLRPWFPADLRAQFEALPSQKGGYRLAAPGYEVSPFIHGAYQHGFCSWVGDKLLLHIYSI
ncbi:MAG: hypothetical protein RLZZ519_1272 [Bacteroidota bacterium]|jgi:hypothetical protein